MCRDETFVSGSILHSIMSLTLFFPASAPGAVSVASCINAFLSEVKTFTCPWCVAFSQLHDVWQATRARARARWEVKMMCWMTVTWWSLLTCPWKQSQKKCRTAGISRCDHYRYKADLPVSRVALLQSMCAVMPACALLCVYVYVYRNRGKAFVDAYLSSMHSKGCPYLTLEEVSFSGHAGGTRSCIPVVSLSPRLRLPQL